MAAKTIKSDRPLYRHALFQRDAINPDARTVEVAFSSEEPVERWFGIEILDHARESVRLTRLVDGGPVLVDHDPSDHVGVVESVSIGPDRRGRAVVRFGRSARAEEIFQDVVDGIRKSISVGYRVMKAAVEEFGDNTPDTVRVTDWEPLEISFVSVPADATVGVGRGGGEGFEFEIRQLNEEHKEMSNQSAAPAVNVEEIRAEARKTERERVATINLMGEKFGKAEMARQFIDSGKGVDEFRNALLESMDNVAPVKSADYGDVGLNERESRDFSFVKAIRALANPTDRRAQEAAAFEFEASRAAAKAYGREPQGILVPMEVLRYSDKRDQTVGTGSGGGYLKGTTHLGASFIEVLRNRMVLRDMGAMVLDGLVGDLAIPSQTGGATGYWISTEGNAPGGEDALTFGQLSMSPHTVAAYVDYTRKLMLQSSPSIEALVRADLAATLAIKVDAAGINGSGSSGQPTGILNTVGIGAVAIGTNGGAPTWASVVNLIREVEVDNAALGSLAFLTNPKVVAKMRQTPRQASGVEGNFIMGESNNLLGYGVTSTNQVPSTLTKGGSGAVCSAMIFGNFNDLVIGEWSGIDLLVDPYTASNTGTTRVTAFYDVDVGVRHAASFAAVQDYTTT